MRSGEGERKSDILKSCALRRAVLEELVQQQVENGGRDHHAA